MEETPTLKRVRQSRQHPLWRVSHPFEEGIALRLVVWFPPGLSTAVVIVIAADKAQMGDVFYDRVGRRADAAIRAWQRQREQEGER